MPKDAGMEGCGGVGGKWENEPEGERDEEREDVDAAPLCSVSGTVLGLSPSILLLIALAASPANISRLKKSSSDVGRADGEEDDAEDMRDKSEG